MYCGTTTGDIMVINIKSCRLQGIGPEKDRISRGITALAPLASNGDILVGGGDGTITMLKPSGEVVKRLKG